MKNKKRSFIIAITVVVIAVVIVYVFSLFPYSKKTEKSHIEETDITVPSGSESQVLQSTNEAPSTQAFQPSTQEQTESASVEIPSELSRLLSLNNNTPEQLSGFGCKQLVTVESFGSEARICFYELKNNEWIQNNDLSCSGFVGHNGVTENMHEGGYATPKGLYSVGEAFYIDDKPTTGLDIFQITENTYWVDDPNSSMYNCRVEGRQKADWNSAEHMISFRPSYDYGFVIDYNTEAVYNAGSAIFFHYSGDPTAGCVGTSTKMVLRYLAALDKKLNPYILIV